MEIPFTALSADALRGVIEEFISREGTDYGDGGDVGDRGDMGDRADREYSHEDKIAQVKKQLERGEVCLTYDGETESCNLLRVK